MTRPAAKGRKLTLLAAVCLVASLLLAPSAEATRSLPASLSPGLGPPVFIPPAATAEPSFALLTGEDRTLFAALSILQDEELVQVLERRRFRPLGGAVSRDLESGVSTRLTASISLGTSDLRWKSHQGDYFLEPDPLGPVDSPNLYQAFGFDGMNVVDPWGMDGFNIIADLSDQDQFARQTLSKLEYDPVRAKEGEKKAVGISAAVSAPIFVGVSLPALGLSGPLLTATYTSAGVGALSSSVQAKLSGGDAEDVLYSASVAATFNLATGPFLPRVPVIPKEFVPGVGGATGVYVGEVVTSGPGGIDSTTHLHALIAGVGALTGELLALEFFPASGTEVAHAAFVAFYQGFVFEVPFSLAEPHIDKERRKKKFPTVPSHDVEERTRKNIPTVASH